MGQRGPAPIPTVIKVLEGNRGKRALNANEPQYPAGVPDRPADLTRPARRIWDELVAEMAPSGVLRRVDACALAQLCEDEALLAELRKGGAALGHELSRQAKAAKKKIHGNPMTQMARTIEGRRMFATIRELAGSISAQRREFGLTPASNSRVSTAEASIGNFGAGRSRGVNRLESRLCG